MQKNLPWGHLPWGQVPGSNNQAPMAARYLSPWQIKVQLFSETNKEFNNNLVVWQILVWLFGKFSFGCLVSIHLEY